MMEKHGAIRPGSTPDVERKLGKEKQSGDKAQTRALDDDVTKRLSDAAAKRPGKPQR